MKIALVTEFSVPYYAGGGERRYFEIAKLLVRAGHDVTWICMHQKDSPDEEIIDGVRVVHLGPRIRDLPHRSLGDFAKFEMALIWHFLTNDYDVADSQPFSPLLGAWLGTLLKRTKLVATIYDITSDGEDQFLEHGWLGRIVEKILYRLPYKKVVTISDSVQDVLINRYGIPKRKLKLIYCGVNLEEFDAVPKQKKVRDLIYVGRMVPHKHVDDFVNLCEMTGAKGAIVGEGPLSRDIRKLIKNKRLEKRVKFLGKLEKYSDVVKEMKRSEILVLPSTREGFGMVLVEAGACNLPVVAYFCNGVVDVVEQGKTGYLVTQRDVKGMAAKVKRLLKDSKLRRKMGKAHRKRVERLFTWKQCAKKLEQQYKRR